MDGRTTNLTYHILMQGGVNDGSWFINLYIPNPLEEIWLIRQAKRDLGCMLDSTCGSWIPCAPPNKGPSLLAPQVIELHPVTYSYQGLLPWSSFIFTPSIFTPTKFCRRCLTGTELMHILDIPANVIESLSSKEIKAIIEDFSFYLSNVSVA